MTIDHSFITEDHYVIDSNGSRWAFYANVESDFSYDRESGFEITKLKITDCSFDNGVTELKCALLADAPDIFPQHQINGLEEAIEEEARERKSSEYAGSL